MQQILYHQIWMLIALSASLATLSYRQQLRPPIVHLGSYSFTTKVQAENREGDKGVEQELQLKKMIR